MKEMICIICPRGCKLTIDENNTVSGNFCPRGKDYAISELTCPMRMLTTTMRVSNRENIVVSVRTNKPIPKKYLFDVVKIINKHKIEAPVKVNQILVKNILNLDVDIIATKEVL